MARSPYPRSDRELAARIGRSAGGKAGYKQLIRELGLGGGRERRLLLEQLTRMVARGELRQPEPEMWALPKAEPGASGGVITSGHGATRPPHDSRHQPAADLRSGRERFASGRLELHRDGFGFVRPQPATSARGTRSAPDQDIFIPPNALYGAMHGDLVLVEEEPPGRDGRRSGRIARVLTRRNPTLVGIFHYGSPSGRRRHAHPEGSRFADFAGNFVQPFDERLGGPIEIPAGAEIVVSGAGSPHRTLGGESTGPSLPKAPDPATIEVAAGAPEQATDPEQFASAVAVQTGDRSHPGQNNDETKDSRWPLEGVAVEVEITSFPQPGRPARGRLVDVLGPPDAFGVDVEIIIRKHAIPHTFPGPVLAEADERASETAGSLSAAELALRQDFRDLPTVTIDGETARDFDDAVLVRSLENGNTELQVHIADVSWYVRPGSALDTEARVRGTSVYFPDRAVPMLPHALSSGMCSLLPGQDRLTLSCVMEIDARGEIVSYRVAEGIIRSARRMTYTSVQRCLNASPEASVWNTHGRVTPEAAAEDRGERERIALENPELPAAFDRMLDLALRLNRKRVRRGSIDFDLPEPVVAFDPDGNMKAIVRSERGWAHRLIEEFMLSANECVATWLTAQGIPSLYRIHEMPDPKRILEFEETAAGFGQTLGIGALPVKRLSMKGDRREAQRRSARGHDSRTPRGHEIPERIAVTPQMYQRLVRRIAGKPEERILAYLMLRSLKQARYAEKNEGHFALASPCYTHFTSPIRRYPDLIVHRLVRAMLRRGAHAVGGPLLSTDPQPWAAEARPFAEQSSPAPSAKRFHDVPQDKTFARRKRTGRVGWSSEEGVSTSFGNALHDAGLPKNGVERAADTNRFVSDSESVTPEELADIAIESSQAERRAADAERELIEWKKMKFMADKIGDDFRAIILSVTKYGFFVELDELFIEGLVPLGSLTGDFYGFRDADRTICGARTGHCFRAGDRVEVILDRIDRQQRRLQFALLPGTEPSAGSGKSSLRAAKSTAKKVGEEASIATRKAPKTKGKANRKRRKG